MQTCKRPREYSTLNAYFFSFSDTADTSELVLLLESSGRLVNLYNFVHVHTDIQIPTHIMYIHTHAYTPYMMMYTLYKMCIVPTHHSADVLYLDVPASVVCCCCGVLEDPATSNSVLGDTPTLFNWQSWSSRGA